MPEHEYKVIPAPSRPQKVRGVKTTSEKFALALTTLMNEMAREGWDYVRAETLPCEETKGWTGRKDTSFQTVLVFRRERGAPTGAAVALPEAVPVPLAEEAPAARHWPAGVSLPGVKPAAPPAGKGREGGAPPVVMAPPAPVSAPAPSDPPFSRDPA